MKVCKNQYQKINLICHLLVSFKQRHLTDKRDNLDVQCQISTSFCHVSFKQSHFNPLSANPTKCSDTLKQFVGNLPSNCLSVFAHFVGLALKGLMPRLNYREL